MQKGKTGWWLRPVSPAASGKRNLHRKVASPYSRGTLDRWLHSLARRARRWCASYNVRGLLSPASAEAAVDGEDGAGYEVGCGRRKVDEGSGYFFDRCNASEGNTGRLVVAHAGAIERSPGELGFNKCGGDGVYRDLVRRPLKRQYVCQHDDCGFAGAVRRALVSRYKPGGRCLPLHYLRRAATRPLRVTNLSTKSSIASARLRPSADRCAFTRRINDRVCSVPARHVAPPDRRDRRSLLPRLVTTQSRDKRSRLSKMTAGGPRHVPCLYISRRPTDR